ncbi:MAG: hypothetical protein ACD_4C00099G0003 [uncultured bacterium (gcode 4)]|uniref:Uncharacterized protein n=1 Tax=uncultured bacterium (gcode 4) TaxID=1234023 RepID=K2FYK0_9BACT|nr:MAG: hypothetical protein ACD_4C00099G0003 [uncultured bacterium (gcode 4)]
MNFNIIELLILLFLIPFAFAWLSLAPWVPTIKKDIIRAMNLVDFKIWDNFYEIWCWDWRITFYAGKNFNINAYWIEICYPLYLYCVFKNFIIWSKNISFKNKDIFKFNLENADVIYLYWMPDKNTRFVEKFNKELKKWTKIISYTFEIKWLEPIKIDKPWDKDLPIYVYEI